MKLKYKLGIVGGTFDRFHLGHQALLDAAFAQSERVIIGVATSKLYQQKFLSHVIEDYKTREGYVTDYLKSRSYTSRAIIIPINDIYGNSLTEKNIEAIFVTESNAANVQKVNDQRSLRGFTPLEVVNVPFVLGNDREIITSERIRKGEIDRKGNAFRLLFKQHESFSLPESVREEVRKPFGNVFLDILDVQELYKDKLLIAVGNIVALSLFKRGRQADISIVDLKTRRHALTDDDIAALCSFPAQLSAKNHSGTIEKQAVAALQESIIRFFTTKIKQTLIISGEEDLLAIPAVLLAPLQSVVVYGQYGKGVIAVEVTEEKKKEVASLFKKFQ